MLHSEGNLLAVDHPLVTSLLNALRKNEVNEKVSAMTASCDAWFYNNQLGIPTVVYGAGTLKVAHSKEEQLALTALADAAVVLTTVVHNFCQ